MKFDEWFKRQVGPRPSSISTAKLIQNAREHEEEGRRLRQMISECNEWDAKYAVAHQSWLAAGGRE